mmetsp:Transcript_33251/g.71264  ORF Transcript_33251/g.71264 Transcript_33251/m.71264 type:complete len:410 (-) Transcript_33251:122-1351(-)
MSILQASSPSPSPSQGSVGSGYHHDGFNSHSVGRTFRPKTEPLWKLHDSKANKTGSRGTIYWVGKAIIGEDGEPTGQRTKGANYHGEWSGNKKHGYGVQVFPSGEKYEGQWAGDRRQGEGTLWAPTGKGNKLRKVYVGGWQEDQRHGRGTCYLKSGEFFQGTWVLGKMHGQGTMRYANGDLYAGEWHQGLRSGRGTLSRANGDCYEGYWLADKREGSGSYFYAESGKVFVGEWANDLPKAGIYTQSTPNPEQAGGVPITTTLPPVRLARPAELLEGALAAVREGRKAFRSKAIPLERLFTEEEIHTLQDAFYASQLIDGLHIGFTELLSLCAKLGADLSSEDLVLLLEGAQLLEEGANPDALALDCDSVLRLIAILLDQEELAGSTVGFDEEDEQLVDLGDTQSSVRLD